MVIKEVVTDTGCNNCGRLWKQKSADKVPLFCVRCHSAFYTHPHQPGTIAKWQKNHPHRTGTERQEAYPEKL